MVFNTIYDIFSLILCCIIEYQVVKAAVKDGIKEIEKDKSEDHEKRN